MRYACSTSKSLDHTLLLSRQGPLPRRAPAAGVPSRVLYLEVRHSTTLFGRKTGVLLGALHRQESKGGSRRLTHIGLHSLLVGDEPTAHNRGGDRGLAALLGGRGRVEVQRFVGVRAARIQAIPRGKAFGGWIPATVGTSSLSGVGVGKHAGGMALRVEVRQQLLHRGLKVPRPPPLPSSRCDFRRQGRGDGLDMPSEYTLEPA